MFAVIARAIGYTAFFAKLTAQHVVIDEFDPSTNCARVVVVETGFPGNEQCIEGAWVPGRIDQSDVTFEEPARAAPPAESETPEISTKGRL